MAFNYHIWQNFRVGKLLRLEYKMGIRGKTFTVTCLIVLILILPIDKAT